MKRSKSMLRRELLQGGLSVEQVDNLLEEGSHNSKEKRQARVLFQVRCAARNLTRGEPGLDHSDLDRKAAQVLWRLADALEHGGAYLLTGLAEEFDHTNKNKD